MTKASVRSPLWWLPAVEDLEGALQAASACSDAGARLAQYVALARTRLGATETRDLDRAVRQNVTAPASGWPRLRLAVLGDSRLEPLAPAIRVAGLRRGLWIDVHVGGYGLHAQELLGPDAALARFAPEIVLLAVRAQEAFEDVPLEADTQDVDARIDAWVERQALLWKVARERFGAWPLQQTLLDTSPALFGSYDGMVDATPVAIRRRCNEALRARARSDGAGLLDLAAEGARAGSERWIDPVYWYHGKQAIAPSMTPLYGDLVARIAGARLGRSRKCIVLDLDDTLWGGTIGEDGVRGIVLGQGDPAGEAFRDFQRYVARLAERGIVVAVCSKNDAGNALAAFREHPEMVLREKHVAAFAVDWRDKATKLRELAERLNLGLDSIVFVDNDPFERALVRRMLPEVAVPELPAEPTAFASCVAEAGYFEAIAFTPEDRERTRHYVAEQAREQARSVATSLDAFLVELDMRLAVGPFRDVDVPRIAQLMARTNQFNLSGRRYDETDLEAVKSDPSSFTVQGRLRDRLGDSGLVSAAVVESGPESGTLTLAQWVMSCRVFGRGVEQALCNAIVKLALGAGGRRLVAAYRPTPRNALVAEALHALGFVRAGVADGGARWELDLRRYAGQPTHVRIDDAAR